MDLNIPSTLDDFTIDWLNEAFLVSGNNYGPIVSLVSERIAVGEGFLGELARLHIEYGDGVAGPATAIAKIPTTDGSLKPLGVMLGVYERESLFYEQVAPKVAIQKPDIYFNGRNAEDEKYALSKEKIIYLDLNTRGLYMPGEEEILIENLRVEHSSIRSVESFDLKIEHEGRGIIEKDGQDYYFTYNNRNGDSFFKWGHHFDPKNQVAETLRKNQTLRVLPPKMQKLHLKKT